MLSQKSEHERVNDGVNQRGRLAGLTRGEHTLGTWWQSQQHTWAQGNEQHRRDDEVGLGQDETHRLRYQRVREEEYERVEEHRGSSSETISKRNTRAVCAKKNAWAEREEKGGWDRHLLGSDIWKHVYIMFIL